MTGFSLNLDSTMRFIYVTWVTFVMLFGGCSEPGTAGDLGAPVLKDLGSFEVFGDGGYASGTTGRFFDPECFRLDQCYQPFLTNSDRLSNPQR